MASNAETAAARVAVVLGSVTGASGVFRDRQDAFSREEGSAILIELRADDAEPFAGAPATDQVRWRLAVVYLTRAVAWQTEVDRMREAGHAALMSDPQLQTLITGLRRGKAEWQSASADLPFGYCAQEYVGRYLSPIAALRRV